MCAHLCVCVCVHAYADVRECVRICACACECVRVRGPCNPFEVVVQKHVLIITYGQRNKINTTSGHAFDKRTRNRIERSLKI